MYKLEFDKAAHKFLAKLPKDQQLRIITALKKLPDEGDIKYLKGTDSLYRLRIGKYRAIYSVLNDILVIRVINIDSRGQIYNRI